ncbi:MAG TPA: hypothetical protein PLM22_03065 [Candidatus Sabulitectum sp.]|nr:hypothetical protein [Candidatus Sabulitectum sp.]HPF31858.1 hypothetical protein [Candidatus Sabulitectum sp.]HPJ27886.1 hypothetical protein [Candidatus Sabulitectum sp.]HPR21885.1 hypothetical protein [Candidatus Sabulitectum sp.]
MRLEISQPPLNTSLMGVVSGVCRFFGREIPEPVLFGRTGHAFIMNISEDLCPSGPYLWDMKPFISLLENSGFVMNFHGFFNEKSTREERSKLEGKLRDELDRGHPCSILNMDNQIISGYDGTGFFCVQPWECDFPPGRLSFGSWEEISTEIHACFYSFHEVEPLEPAFCIQRSLLFALDQLHGNPVRPVGDSVSGIGAYATWKTGVLGGHGESHGNWWNGTVWSECRRMASGYFGEIAEAYPGCSAASRELSSLYGEVAGRLEGVALKETPAEKKVELLDEAATLEGRTGDLLEELAETIET